MSIEAGASIESVNDFPNTPKGMQDRWLQELQAAKKGAEKWKKAGERITKAFLDERGESTDGLRGRRLNVFSANIITLRAMMFGNVPRTEISRRYDDANDDPARVAAEMLERIANADVGKQFSYALGSALDDRLIVGFGLGRVAYEAEFETIQKPAITSPILDAAGMDTGEVRELAPAYTVERKTYEAAPVYYINWRDVLWNPARSWDEVRWIGFRSYLTKDQCVKRFGQKIADAISYAKAKQRETGRAKNDPWQKAEVWEIWCNEERAVYWLVEGMEVICDYKPDPLELPGFFPCPKFLLANPTSKSYEPRADYVLAQDQYEEVNEVTARIVMLEKAIKVVGVYDKQADGVQRMLNEAVMNELIPVDNWAMFAEKGGIKGQVDWLPIEQVAAALQILRDYRTELLTLLYQVSGMSDIMRGATQAGETATAQSIKAKFASVRVQFQQDEFASFATDLQRLRCEVIAKHFDDESIVRESNMQNTDDAQHIPEALQIIRQLDAFRIAIKSEQLAAQDMAALRQEKTEFIAGFAQFLTAAKPIVDAYPAAAPTLIEMLKWAMTGFKGSSTIEGVLDKAIAAMEQNPPQAKPDPNQLKQQEAQGKMQGQLMLEQTKQQGQARKTQGELTADLTRIGAETQAGIREQAAQFAFDTRENQRQEAQATSSTVTALRRRPAQ
jgi:hypothetical protein